MGDNRKNMGKSRDAVNIPVAFSLTEMNASIAKQYLMYKISIARSSQIPICKFVHCCRLDENVLY